MRVIICGAGMGGLVLAHALGEDADVVVLDRDSSAADTGGYRISINHEACVALTTALPSSLLRELRDASDTDGRFEQFTIADARLRPMLVAPEPRDHDRMLAHRRSLRVLLARDLGERVRFGCTVVDVFEDESEASVRLRDGSVVSGDVVVAADGADSTIIRSLLGRALTRDLGLTGIAGSAPLLAPPPDYLYRGPALAFGPDGTGVFLSLDRSATRAARVGGAGREADLVFGVIAPASRLPALRDAPPAALTDAALQRLDRWSPWLARHVRRSDPDRIAAFRFRAADPDGPMAIGSSGRVAALGDAVHAMPPTGGRGASTAICDAVELAAALRGHLGGRPLDAALASYQRGIVPRARDAIRESLGPVRMMRFLQHRPARLLAAPLMQLAGRIGERRSRSAT